MGRLVIFNVSALEVADLALQQKQLNQPTITFPPPPPKRAYQSVFNVPSTPILA